MKKIFLALSLLLSLFVSAKSGILRGKITDAQTGEELIGATVIIAGTYLGTSADLDGEYTIDGLHPGRYHVVCQYVSYQKNHFDIVISDGKVTVKDIQLLPVSMGLQQVEIVAKASRKTEAALLTIQKKSSNVIEGLSAQQIARSGDGDAAGALKRVTGINVEGGRYVYVRGLSDRYSKTTLNKADIPGLDPNKNTVQMDIFPTSLIENIIIYKTFSPNLSGDFTGGLINIETRDFPETFTLSTTVSLGYNTNASFNSNFLGYKGSATDFLGFDNGFRSIPSMAQGKLPQYPNNKPGLTAVAEQFNKIMSPVSMPSSLNGSASFAIGNQKLIGKKKKQILGILFGLSYKKEDSFYKNGIKGRYKLGGSADSVLITEHKYQDEKGVAEYLWGALFNLSYKPSRNHKISLNIFKNQSGTSTARYLFGKKPSDDASLYVETRTLAWQERSLNTAMLKGEHYFENVSKLKVDWIGSVASSYQNEPDMRFFTNSYFPENEGKYRYSIQASIYQLPARYYRLLKEINYHFKADFTLNLSQNRQGAKLKFGGAYALKKRDFSEKRLDYRFQFSQYTYNGDVSAFLSNENIGTHFSGYNPMTGSNFGIYIQGNAGDDLKNSYDANQTVGAAYAMVDAAIGEKLRLIAGARFEHAVIHSASKDSTLQAGYLNNKDLLPALNLTYALTDKMNVRLNMSRTLARPNFRELAPYASFDFAGGEVYVGNHNLKRTRIDNLDLRWAYYFQPDELLTLGGFYKKFKNPIELIDNPRAQNTELSWGNVDVALVYGIELDFRKKLDFWRFTKNFKFGVNFTYVRSEVAIDSLELVAIRATNLRAQKTRAMSGQSPYILNSFLSYSNANSGLEAHLAYNVTGPRIVIVVKGGTPNIKAQPLHSLNFNIKKRIGEKLSVGFSAKNLLNAKYKETYTFKGREYIYRQYQTGITFEAGFSYKF